MKLFLFGAPRLLINNACVHIGRRKSVALLAYLAITKKPQNRPALAAMLWPDRDRTAALASERQAIALLKRLLGAEMLDLNPQTVALRFPDSFWVDVEEFQKVFSRSVVPTRQGDYPGLQLERLFYAVELYQAEFMAGFVLKDAPDFDFWQSEQAAILKQAADQLFAELLQQTIGQGKLVDALTYARRWVHLDPLHEPAQQQFIRLLLKTGQRDLAARQHAEFVSFFHHELGIFPELDLAKMLIQGPDLKPVKVTFMGRCLPVWPTPFIGRQKELSALATLLQNPGCRLLTLLGMGGVGKSRLAVEVARLLAPNFPDGLAFVSLTEARTAQDLLLALAQALFLFVPPDQDVYKHLLHYLRDRQMLLLLDNFEHLLPARGLIAEILLAAPGCQFFLTSRERLNLQGEWLFPLEGMAYPTKAEFESDGEGDPITHDAIAFFIRCLHRITPYSRLSARDWRAVLHICQMLDGLPLGLELAAGWSRVLSCTEIAAELAQGPDRLPAGCLDRSARHASLQAVCDYSWGLLPPTMQQQARQLAVFNGAFNRRAAAAVADTMPEDLTELVDKSLLTLSPSGAMEKRFIWHPVIHHYAQKHLAEWSADAWAARTRHVNYFMALLEKRVGALQGAQQREALVELTDALKDVRAAWRWAISQDMETAVARGLSGLYLYYAIKGFVAQGAEEMELAVAHWRQRAKMTASPGLQKLVGRLLVYQGLLLLDISEPQSINEALQTGLALLASETGSEEVALAYRGLGTLALRQGQTEEALELLEESLLQFEAVGAVWHRAGALTNLGTVYVELGQLTQASQMDEAALIIYRELENDWGIAICLNNLSHIAEMVEEYHRAETLLEEGMQLARKGDIWGLTAVFHSNLAHIAGLRGRRGKAQKHLQHSLALRMRHGLPGVEEIRQHLTQSDEESYINNQANTDLISRDII
jgi:predicted ATPase/DNA-binding SARP family transcriptional activator